MRKILIAALIACTAITPISAQKFGKKGGVGSADSVYTNGEPSGGTYSINGATGVYAFSKVGSPLQVANNSGNVLVVNQNGSTSLTGALGVSGTTTLSNGLAIVGGVRQTGSTAVRF